MSNGYSETDTRFEARSHRSQVALQKSHRDLCTPISLRVVLWGVLLESLLEALNSEVTERFGQELHNGRLIVALESEPRITKPLNVLDKCTN